MPTSANSAIASSEENSMPILARAWAFCSSVRFCTVYFTVFGSEPVPEPVPNSFFAAATTSSVYLLAAANALSAEPLVS